MVFGLHKFVFRVLVGVREPSFNSINRFSFPYKRTELSSSQAVFILIRQSNVPLDRYWLQTQI